VASLKDTRSRTLALCPLCQVQSGFGKLDPIITRWLHGCATTPPKVYTKCLLVLRSVPSQSSDQVSFFGLPYQIFWVLTKVIRRNFKHELRGVWRRNNEWYDCM